MSSFDLGQGHCVTASGKRFCCIGLSFQLDAEKYSKFCYVLAKQPFWVGTVEEHISTSANAFLVVTVFLFRE